MTKTLNQIFDACAENIRGIPSEPYFEERREGDYLRDQRVTLTYRRTFVQSAGAVGSSSGLMREEIEFRKKGREERVVSVLRRVGEKYTLKSAWGNWASAPRRAARRVYEMTTREGDDQ